MTSVVVGSSAWLGFFIGRKKLEILPEGALESVLSHVVRITHFFQGIAHSLGAVPQRLTLLAHPRTAAIKRDDFDCRDVASATDWAELRAHDLLRLTSKMSHDHGRRAACRLTIWSPAFHFDHS
jgi:hypothetical protein